MKKLVLFLGFTLVVIACNSTSRFVDCIDGCTQKEVIVIDNTAQPAVAMSVAEMAAQNGISISDSPSDPLTTCADMTGQNIPALQAAARAHALAVGGATAYWYVRFEANDKSYVAAAGNAYASRPFLSDLVSTEYKAYVDAGGAPIIVPAKFKTSAGSGCTMGRLQSVHDAMISDFNAI